MTQNTPPAVFITFPPSSGCESVSWLLKLYGLPVSVRAHTVPFFSIFIRLHGGTDYPFVEYRGVKMSGCSNVYRELPKLVPTEKKLLPADPAQQESLYRIWDEEVFLSFDPVPHWAYFYLLPHKHLLLDPLTRGVPWWEKATVNICYPLTAAMIRKGLGIDAVTPPTQAQDTIRKGFDYLDKRLADGRPYLMGDALTVLDIGTAALAAPAIFEPLYGEGGLLPPLEKTPAAMLPLIHELRERPAARYITRIYQQHRL